jgi:[ribosomal protein S18]-alanine N-acetyltransferase
MTVAVPRIVPMTDGHVDLLLPYEHELFGSEAWSAAGYRAELADTRSRYYVAVEGPDGELLGWGGVLVAADQAEILTVGVIPAAQRQGLARAMLAELSAEARRRGARELFLEVRVDNAAAIALYTGEGFTDIGRRRGYYDHGRVDAMVMRRAL